MKKIHKIFQTKNKNKLNVVDLFSGCGGLSLGFGMAGYNIKAMIDFDKDSLLTAEKNELAEHYLNLDLFEEDWIKGLTSKFKLKPFDTTMGCMNQQDSRKKDREALRLVKRNPLLNHSKTDLIMLGTNGFEENDMFKCC